MTWFTDKRVSIISLFVTIAALLVATIISLAAMRQNHVIALESGVFSAPNIDASISGLRLERNKVHRVYFGTPEKHFASGLVIAPITTIIRNSGDAALEDLYLSFRYHEILRREGLELLSYEFSGAVASGDIDRNFSKGVGSDFVNYKINSLNPGTAVSIDEPFVLKETWLTQPINLEGHETSIEVRFAIEVRVSISAKSELHQDYDLAIEVLKAENFQELAIIFETQIAERHRKLLRDESSFTEYLGLLLFSDSTVEALLSFPLNSRHAQGEAVIYSPDSGKVQTAVVTYELAEWARLF